VKARAICGTLIVALTMAASAGGAAIGEGDLIATFDGSLHPTVLPRQEPAPVAVRVAGNLRSATGDTDSLPQLRTISVAINRQGRLFDRGLPVCRARQIQPGTPAGARAKCGDSLVGRGHVRVQVRLAGQLPFLVRAKLLAFKGPRQNGDRLILAQAYAEDPPGSFVLVFHLKRKTGTYGTVLTTTLPGPTQKWAYLTHFDMTLHRLYDFHGERRSYVSAACSAPAGFEQAVFPFARATYSFATGQQLKISEAAVCRVAS
jgi:hypothetical protein